MTEYDIEYMGVKCTGVEWGCNSEHIFHFEKNGKKYEFEQEYAICLVSDTDYIRAIIEYQFLPWWKDQRIKELETENAELRAGLDKKDIFTSGDTDSLSGIQKFFISVVKTGILPQEPMNYDGAAMKVYISYLETENAALRERLENAVEFPFRTGQELYMIDDFKHANVWKGICNGIEVKQTRIPQRVLFYVYVAFEDPETCTLRARKFTNETLNEIYTTREVAEARLAELKGETK